jgi:hypothetical protein
LSRLRPAGSIASGEFIVRAVLSCLAFLVGWAASYASGAWPWLGYASMTRSTFGAGPVTIIGENRRGIDVGLETFFFFKGQEIVIDYDAEIRAGSLWLYVYRPSLAGTLMHSLKHRVRPFAKEVLAWWR